MCANVKHTPFYWDWLLVEGTCADTVGGMGPRLSKQMNFGREAGGGRWCACGHAALQGDGRALYSRAPSYWNLLLLLTCEKVFVRTSWSDTQSLSPRPGACLEVFSLPPHLQQLWERNTERRNKRNANSLASYKVTEWFRAWGKSSHLPPSQGTASESSALG